MPSLKTSPRMATAAAQHAQTVLAIQAKMQALAARIAVCAHHGALDDGAYIGWAHVAKVIGVREALDGALAMLETYDA